IGSSDNTGLTTLTDVSDKCVANNGTLSGFTLNGANSNWVNDSSASFTGKIISIQYPNIAISGNALCITTGDVTPSSTDFTDFGSYTGSTITRTFTINNTGNTTLTIGAVTITGTNAASFAVTGLPAASVAAGSSTTFKISYTPAVTGTSNATINVANSDPDEAPYTFAISGSSVTLPVELISFKGEKNNDKVKLSWQTASEHNNKGFEIQRSADGATGWEKIGFVTASANPSILNSYNFTDAIPISGINAYRLKQTDLDGNYNLSQVVVLNFTGKGAVISFYPNPVKNKITIQFNDNTLLNTNVQISSITGRIVLAAKLVSNRQEIDLGNLPQGIYLLSFDNGEVKRLIKQ
ncbi:MAG: choice-of-anchor D domain-containing protein, partial [Ferruginibacter sp.]